MTDAARKVNFDLKYLFTGEGMKDWFKAWGSGWRLGITLIVAVLLLAGAVRVWNFIFPKAKQNISQPRVVALPGSTIGPVDQRTIQVAVEEKPWEVSIGAGVFSYDNKTGSAAGCVIKRKF